MPSAARAPRGQTSETAHIPAPTGGINTVASGSAFPPLDCRVAYNVVAGADGLRVRLGYREWATNVAGLNGNEVRSLIPFTGSQPGTDKLWAVTSLGIYDVTASSAAPSLVASFSYNDNRAGYGSSVVMTTGAGRFMLYCDESNGLFVWDENAASWVTITVSTRAPWTALTTYLAGDYVVNGGNIYVCSDAEGESASSGGPTGTGTGITDGTTEWDYVGVENTTAIGPSVADQRLGRTFAPEDLAHVTVWKNRVWLTQRNSSLAWYLDVNSLYGEAAAFDFGTKMRLGGALVGLFNWSYDGGAGLDTSLVGISKAGDVVIYQGTNPNSASTFGLKGCWSVGAVPEGRRIATDIGGDLVVLSLIGIVPLSRLVVGADKADPNIYATEKIANVFSELAIARRGLPGWGLWLHPTDNVLVVTVPTTAGAATEQLVMSLATRGWTRYRDLPIMGAATWHGDFYFGTADGRVCRQEGAADNVVLNASSHDAIDWGVVTAFRNLGTMRHKKVHLIRPVILGGLTPISTEARYDYDLSEADAPAGSAGAGWDYEEWDSAIWGGDDSPAFAPMGGAVGIGRDVAIAIRGSAVSRVTLVSFDVVFEQGGIL